MEHAKTTARVASGRPRCCACIAVRAGGPGWNDRYDHRYGQRREYARADRRRTSHRLSPSQVAHVSTDASGRFTFLSLAPDTYAISAEHGGYETNVLTGISVFADQSQIAADSPAKKHQEIARVTSRSSLSPVRPGTGTDVYSVNPGADRGGGAARRRRRVEQRVLRDRRDAGRVRSAQSGRRQSNRLHSRRILRPDRLRVRRRADQSLVRQLPGQLRNDARAARAPDLHRRRRGRRERDGPGAASSTRSSRPEPFPDTRSAAWQLGTPTFYHDARVEAGGSTPDRLFSYYVGISGTNQDFRYFDQYNGASLTDTIPVRLLARRTSRRSCHFYPAVYPTCSEQHDVQQSA